MKKRKLWTILIVIASTFNIGAQTLFMSDNQKLVEQAIKGGLFIVRQTYQLEDTTTHQRFGRYGNPAFGQATSLAVRSADGCIIASAVLSPWESDDNFARYRDSHRPILSRAYSMELGDTAKTPISITTDTIVSLLRGLSIMQDTISGGFESRYYQDPTDGWTVWVSGDSTINDYQGLQEPTLTIIRRSIEFGPDSVSYAVAPPQVQRKIWGGIFVVPEQTEIGQITFYLGGVMIMDKATGSWVVIPMKMQEVTRASVGENELTPLSEPVVGKKKKNRKSKRH